MTDQINFNTKDTFIGAYLVDKDEYEIWFNGKKLDLHLDEVDHSPTGFCWGYSGSGPSQSAYCVLREAIMAIYGTRRSDLCIELAKRLYMRFKGEVISKFPMSGSWTLTLAQINTWIQAHITPDDQMPLIGYSTETEE